MIEREREAVLVLEDGRFYPGRSFGAVGDAGGEVVFDTAMTGYQEMCTDPSFRGQILTLTYPIIGNYGVTECDRESRQPWIAGLVVREYVSDHSNWRSEGDLDSYLKKYNIPGIHGVDTRALTRHLRTNGLRRGVLAPLEGSLETELGYLREHLPGRQFNMPAPTTVAEVLAEYEAVLETRRANAVLGNIMRAALPSVARLAALVERAKRTPLPSEYDAVRQVTTPEEYAWCPEDTDPNERVRIVLIDCGLKENILRSLNARNAEVVVVPCGATPAEVMACRPDGIMTSPGPGDPEVDEDTIGTIRGLIHTGTPFFGICLGHQLLSLAIGAKTSRLKFGHRGGNHPVMDLATGRSNITSQNHGFHVDKDSIPAESGFYVSHTNLNDGSVEGLAHPTLPVFSVQYHPEGSPGPQDNQYLFDRFIKVVREKKMEREGR